MDNVIAAPDPVTVFEGAGQAAGNCVFFAQQSVENRSKSLWEGAFFIAWEGASDNVGLATEGGIPVSRFPVCRIVRRLAGSKRGSSKGAVARGGY